MTPRAHEPRCPKGRHSHEIFRRSDGGGQELAAWATWLGDHAELKAWPITPAGMAEAAAWAADARAVWRGTGHTATPDDIVLLLQAPETK